MAKEREGLKARAKEAEERAKEAMYVGRWGLAWWG